MLRAALLLPLPLLALCGATRGLGGPGMSPPGPRRYAARLPPGARVGDTVFTLPPGAWFEMAAPGQAPLRVDRASGRLYLSGELPAGGGAEALVKVHTGGGRGKGTGRRDPRLGSDRGWGWELTGIWGARGCELLPAAGPSAVWGALGQGSAGEQHGGNAGQYFQPRTLKNPLAVKAELLSQATGVLLDRLAYPSRKELTLWAALCKSPTLYDVFLLLSVHR